MIWRTVAWAAVAAMAASAVWAAAPANPASQPDETALLEELMRRVERAVARPAPADSVNERDQAAAASQPDERADDDEENDLIRRLLEEAAGGGKKPIMVAVIDDMGLSRTQLREKFDPGKETQDIQDRIIKNLDEAIDMAQQSQGGGQGQSKSKGQKGEKGQRQQAQSSASKSGQSKPGQPKTNRAATPAASEVASHGAVQEGARNPKIEEGRTEWGGLPARDRDEVVQGHNEEMLARWKALIEKYYTALSVQSQNKE